MAMFSSRFISALALVIAIGFSAQYMMGYFSVEADPLGEIIIKEKSITLNFNEQNPGGSIDLKKIVEEELSVPPECNEALTVCYIQEVTFNINIRKQWQKFDIVELTNQQFAEAVPRLENSIDELTIPEVVVMQEVLARRGLLHFLDGSVVHERGFFGALTWMGLLRLSHIKGLNPGTPEFTASLTQAVNDLLENMAKDENYVTNRPLPSREDMEPSEGDIVYTLWKNYSYLAILAENSEKVDVGDVFIGGGVDVDIDGFVNIERTTQ